MWDALPTTPLGTLTWRKLLAMVTVFVVTVFAYIFITAPLAHAADVSWQGSSLNYQNNTYADPATATSGDGRDLPAGATYYTYVEPQVGFAPQKVHILYFAAGTDPVKATTAQYVTYEMNSGGSLGNKSSATQVSVDPANAPPSATTNNRGDPTGSGSCAVPGGLGWIICPLATTLANGMDWIYKVIASFLVTQPLQTGQQGSLYQAWSFVRNLANVIFIISFMIIIYSQLTSYGISNYGIKKMLPRLIVAAVLVNISYYLAAIAIDLSNITGSAVFSMIEGIQKSIASQGNLAQGSDVYNWTSIIGVVLSGGAAVGALGIGIAGAIASAGGTIAAMIYMLVPLLVGLFLTVLVVLLILAARHAIIIALVIVSPLAFVAYLLPGTEKWFDRWKDVFITMLVFYPAFSFAFAGAQLAGSLIIQNASGPNALNMIVLGMAVQVAPLVITPLLLKLSGGLLGRIANVVNNPNKGLLDRTKNWAGARADMHRQRGLGDGTQLSRANVLRNYARRREGVNREIKERTANYGTMADNVYNASARHGRQDMLHRETEEEKELIGKQYDQRWNRHVATNAHAAEADLQLRVLSDEVARGKESLDARYEEAKAGETVGFAHQSQALSELVSNARDTSRDLAVEGLRKQSARMRNDSEFADTLRNNATLRVQAAGINNENDKGEQRVLSTAISQIEKEKSQMVEHIKVATSVSPGDADGYAREFAMAARTGNAEGMRAYADLMAGSGNPGVSALRKSISNLEGIMPDAAKAELKAHINASGPINGAAEDIAQWSRDSQQRQIRDITADTATWNGMAANAFAGMKKSSQEAALKAGGISVETAKDILKGPAFQNLKPDMRARIKQRANNDPTYADNITIY